MNTRAPAAALESPPRPPRRGPCSCRGRPRVAPSGAKCWAMPWPMPDVDPVTTATSVSERRHRGTSTDLITRPSCIASNASRHPRGPCAGRRCARRRVRPAASRWSTRSQIGQLWLNDPCSRTFFWTSGLRFTPSDSGDQPTFVTCPSGRTSASAASSVRLEPEASQTRSAPSGLRSRTTASRSSTCASTMCVAPSAPRRLEPLARRPSAPRRPAGWRPRARPSARTATRSARVRARRRGRPDESSTFTHMALYATACGSRQAREVEGSASGTWCRQRAGTFTYSAIAPSTP